MKKPILFNGIFTIPLRLKIFSSLAFLCIAQHTLAGTYTVGNTNNTGAGSLRQAIIDANGNAGADVINFTISGTITLQSLLPYITGPVAINGYTATGAAQGPIGSRAITITVDGNNTVNVVGGRPGSSNLDGLFRFTSGASGSSISGLAIINTGSSVEAIQVEPGASNIHIWGNYIGVNAAGTAGASTVIRDDAVFLGEHSTSSPYAISNVFIGTDGNGANDANEGNVLSNGTTSDGSDGVQLGYRPERLPLTNVRISGNYIGMAADGNTVAPNGVTGSSPQGFDGILILDIDGTGAGVIIGTDGNGASDVLESNLISGNAGNGIELVSSNGFAIAGNLIGTDKTGMLARPNAKVRTTLSGLYAGITIAPDLAASTHMLSQNIVIGFDALKHNAATAAAVRNIISGNQAVGIDIFGVPSSGQNNNIRIAGNYIGVNITGNSRLGNGQGATAAGYPGYGIGIEDATNITIGTNGDGVSDNLEGNVVSGAIFGEGVRITSNSSTMTNSIVAGNKIGVGANGTTAIGNDNAGITVNSATNIRIGSDDNNTSDAIEANIIANNAQTFGSDGVRVTGSVSTGIRISRNSFYNNWTTPIDLANDGVTLNDGAITTNQPNLLLDYPVITASSLSGTTLTVSGYVSTCNGSETVAGATIAGLKTIQFYKEADDGDQNAALTNGTCTRSVAHGEGMQYLGSITGVTNTFTAASFTLVAGATLSAGDKLTAITIDATGNTSEFGVRTITAILPVKLKEFTASLKGEQTLLQWVTATEQNNKGFEIERSTDGIAWNKIGYAPTKAVSGNSSINISYAFTDISPLPQNNYYRLKQTDMDGKFEYSKTALVRFDKTGSITVYPNPVSSQLNILLPDSWTNKPVKLELVNQAGQVVMSKQVTNAQYTEQLPVGILANGIYILKLQSGGKPPAYKKIRVSK